MRAARLISPERFQLIRQIHHATPTREKTIGLEAPRPNENRSLHRRGLRVPAWSVFLASLCVLSLCMSGCREYGYQLLPNSPRSLLAGATALSVRSAWLLTSGIRIHATVTNEGRSPLGIDYREWALRGPDGRTFPLRQDDACCEQPVALAPGQSQELSLKFPLLGADAFEWPSAELVIGGVRELPSGSVQVVGTVPFARSGMRERYDEQRGHR